MAEPVSNRVPALSFGLLHTMAATVGQTLVISLFLPGIKQSFALNDAETSLLFTGTTLASAAALWRIGAWLDRTDVVRYSVACGFFLALACGVIAASPTFGVLVIGMFCLRLAGNGLLVHVALTATARYFTKGRGKALSIVTLGPAIGEALMPAIIVTLVALWGWRTGFALVGLLAFALVLVAAAGVRKLNAFRRMQPASREPDAASVHLIHAHRPDTRRFFILSAPLFLGMWMVGTATVFHQAVVAESKGLSVQWFAVSFIAFAAARVASSIATGPIVDRIGSRWLFRLHLLPLIVGTAVLATVNVPWVAPFYWLLAGATTGGGIVLQNFVLAERIAPAELARARSIFGAGTIIASAIGPSLFGVALAAGVSMQAVLWSSVAALVAATVLALATNPSLRGTP